MLIKIFSDSANISNSQGGGATNFVDVFRHGKMFINCSSKTANGFTGGNAMVIYIDTRDWYGRVEMDYFSFSWVTDEFIVSEKNVRTSEIQCSRLEMADCLPQGLTAM
jgi:hypothetical protein